MSVSTRKAGTLVQYRGRDWLVMPSDDEDILKIKPLGGSDAEITGVYLPLSLPGEEVANTELSLPDIQDLGDFETAKMLFHASRLLFRNAAGPFRCMGKLSFRPRSYQVVPLVMALKQEVIRLLIADDVGIGKTIEALMILKELLERGIINRFAVVCLPHLCEQWQEELKDKLDIDAKIIRTSTAATLERQLPDDRSVFYHIPYQVISVDYVKSGAKRRLFLQDCPEMVVVDEAHTCARPAGASNTQQQRYHLLNELADDKDRHLVFLTATPHSGKDEEFQSILGLLNKEFERFNLDEPDEKIRRAQREKIANYFIQRKRSNIKRWLNEVTTFPDRETKEIGYHLTSEYDSFYSDVLQFARKITQNTHGPKGTKTHYWAALALLRGVMSSPEAGFEMLKARKEKQAMEDVLEELEDNPVILSEERNSDITESDTIEQAIFENAEYQTLNRLMKTIQGLKGIAYDRKAQSALDIIKSWLKNDINPIIFCRYIATANYLAEILKENLPNTVDVQAISSELADEQRKEKIVEMGKSKKHVLVATDCLSEGINLQEHFTAVLHYDLPWNPNRLEQREGRVDRFGQMAKKVYTYLLWGEDNPIDAVVLKVLIRKVKDIRKATGVSISIGEENRSIIDAVLKEVLLDPNTALQNAKQLSLDFGDNEELNSINRIVSNEMERAKEKAEKLRSIFAHESIKPENIQKELEVVDEVIGDVSTVENLVLQGVRHLGGLIQKTEDGYQLHKDNLPGHLQSTLPNLKIIPISFESPTPVSHLYIGRNHSFTEQLCQFLTALAFDKKTNQKRIARASIIQTKAVEIRTVLVQFRVRNVIRAKGRQHEIIAEEMYLWGYQGTGNDQKVLDYTTCKSLLLETESAANLPVERQHQELRSLMNQFDDTKKEVQKLAEVRAEELVAAHGRFQELVGGSTYRAVYPVLPPDVMGVYVLIPQPKSLF